MTLFTGAVITVGEDNITATGMKAHSAIVVRLSPTAATVTNRANRAKQANQAKQAKRALRVTSTATVAAATAAATAVATGEAKAEVKAEAKAEAMQVTQKEEEAEEMKGETAASAPFAASVLTTAPTTASPTVPSLTRGGDAAHTGRTAAKGPALDGTSIGTSIGTRIGTRIGTSGTPLSETSSQHAAQSAQSVLASCGVRWNVGNCTASSPPSCFSFTGYESIPAVTSSGLLVVAVSQMRGGWGLEGGAALIGLDVETGATREDLRDINKKL